MDHRVKPGGDEGRGVARVTTQAPDYGDVSIVMPGLDPGIHAGSSHGEALSTKAEGTTVNAMAGYIALVHKDEGTSYGVSFPEVPGLHRRRRYVRGSDCQCR